VSLSKPLYQVLGFAFLIIAAIGVILPLLPTTPFLLISAGCFARSSRKWHRKLLENRAFGPLIKNWEAQRCVTLQVKLAAITSILIVGGYSVFFVVDSLNVRIVGGLLIGFALFTLCRLKTCARG